MLASSIIRAELTKPNSATVLKVTLMWPVELHWKFFKQFCSQRFKEPLGEQRGAAHLQLYLDWKRTIAAKEDIFCKRLLEALQIWYAKFPSSKKRSSSLLARHPPDSVERGLLDDPEDDEGPARGAGAGPTAVGARRCGASAAPPAGEGVLNK